jgi:hypothetical protein
MQRIGEVAAGREVSPERATINDLWALVIADYGVRKLRDATIVNWRYEANIKPAVGNLRAAKFGASQVRAYVAARRAAGASDPTINRELSIIRRGFRLGFRRRPADGTPGAAHLHFSMERFTMTPGARRRFPIASLRPLRFFELVRSARTRTNEYRPAPCYLELCRMRVTSYRRGPLTHSRIRAN